MAAASTFVEQNWLGHQTLSMTMRYAHLATNNLDSCLAVLERGLESIGAEARAANSLFLSWNIDRFRIADQPAENCRITNQLEKIAINLHRRKILRDLE